MKKKAIKVLSLLCALVFTASVAGCGQATGSAENNAEGTYTAGTLYGYQQRKQRPCDR